MLFKTSKTRKQIAIFGGSFSPPHVGHTALCKWLFSRGRVDELWIVPCYKHPLGKELLPFEHRLAMCRLAFYKLKLPIRVLDVEEKLGGVSYSLRTIEFLKQNSPDCRFQFITGDDIHEQTNEWRGFDKIRELVEIVRVPRGPNSPIPDVSSTEIRRRILAHESFSDLVEPEVAVYIVTKGLFR